MAVEHTGVSAEDIAALAEEAETVTYWRAQAEREKRRADELAWQLEIITTVVDTNRRLRRERGA